MGQLGFEWPTSASLIGASAGSKSLLAIARALCQKEKRVLILDEATALLSPAETNRVVAVITFVGITIFAVTHQLAVCSELGCEETLRLTNGRLVKTSIAV